MKKFLTSCSTLALAASGVFAMEADDPTKFDSVQKMILDSGAKGFVIQDEVDKKARGFVSNMRQEKGMRADQEEQIRARQEARIKGKIKTIAPKNYKIRNEEGEVIGNLGKNKAKDEAYIPKNSNFAYALRLKDREKTNAFYKKTQTIVPLDTQLKKDVGNYITSKFKNFGWTDRHKQKMKNILIKAVTPLSVVVREELDKVLSQKTGALLNTSEIEAKAKEHYDVLTKQQPKGMTGLNSVKKAIIKLLLDKTFERLDTDNFSQILVNKDRNYNQKTVKNSNGHVSTKDLLTGLVYPVDVNDREKAGAFFGQEHEGDALQEDLKDSLVDYLETTATYSNFSAEEKARLVHYISPLCVSVSKYLRELKHGLVSKKGAHMLTNKEWQGAMNPLFVNTHRHFDILLDQKKRGKGYDVKGLKTVSNNRKEVAQVMIDRALEKMPERFPSPLTKRAPQEGVYHLESRPFGWSVKSFETDVSYPVSQYQRKKHGTDIALGADQTPAMIRYEKWITEFIEGEGFNEEDTQKMCKAFKGITVFAPSLLTKLFDSDSEAKKKEVFQQFMTKSLYHLGMMKAVLPENFNDQEDLVKFTRRLVMFIQPKQEDYDAKLLQEGDFLRDRHIVADNFLDLPHLFNAEDFVVDDRGFDPLAEGRESVNFSELNEEEMQGSLMDEAFSLDLTEMDEEVIEQVVQNVLEQSNLDNTLSDVFENAHSFEIEGEGMNVSEAGSLDIPEGESQEVPTPSFSNETLN